MNEHGTRAVDEHGTRAVNEHGTRLRGHVAPPAPADDRAAVLGHLRDDERFLLLAHVAPDGDALGSLVAMEGVLAALGKDVLVYVASDEFPLPYEYEFLAIRGLVHDVPPDIAQRTVVFLDCGNIDRNPVAELCAETSCLLNIDHHHDNTRFGTINHVVPEASCTAEIVWDLMRALGVEATPEVADALYVGLVTDTGRFMYENTGTRAHVMAAELIKAGVDVQETYRRLYEEMPYAKLALLGRALERVERHDEGRLTLTRLTREDYALAAAEESYSEGVVDHLRSVRGTKVAVLVRELLSRGPEDDDPAPRRAKVSLRATDGAIDVSAIAREQGGGGHRQAAGFTTSLPHTELVAFLRRAICVQLAPA